MRLIILLLLCGCAAPAQDAQMSGPPSNLNMQGYTEMCEREPESLLCQ